MPASLPAIRGAVLEESVLFLLEKVGYRTVQPGEEATRAGQSGLEVRGRGDWHQIDALAAFDHSPAFMYPLRLVLEAKCYQHRNRVGIEVVRNAVGVLVDIAQNYFTLDAGDEDKETQVSRFNYHAAIFSTSGYTSGAGRYAIAHQVFLIGYDDVPLMKPVAEGILGLGHAESGLPPVDGGPNLGDIRRGFRQLLTGDLNAPNRLTEETQNYLGAKVILPLRQIGGSYFGMLQGRFPLHLLAQRPIPEGIFEQSDELECKVYRQPTGAWAFAPSEARLGESFALEFNLPGVVAKLLRGVTERRTIADIKRRNFSFLTLYGIVGGVRRSLRLILDEYWLRRLVGSD